MDIRTCQNSIGLNKTSPTLMACSLGLSGFQVKACAMAIRSHHHQQMQGNAAMQVVIVNPDDPSTW
jgi:hypothetical protein